MGRKNRNTPYFSRAALLAAVSWLIAASPALAHEPHCRAAYQPAYQSFPSSCLAKRSPFRLTHLRTVRIHTTSSLPDEAPSAPRYSQIRRPIDHASCQVYPEAAK